MPPRARGPTRCGPSLGPGPAAEEEKRDTISFRPAGRSTEPFLSRNYKIASLKDPLRAPFSLFSFPSASLPVVSRHQAPSDPLAPAAPPFSSASSRNRQRIIPSSASLPPSPRLPFPLAPSKSRSFPSSPFPFLSSLLRRPLFFLARLAASSSLALSLAVGPYFARVTTMGNFNARPALPNDFIQRNTAVRDPASRGPILVDRRSFIHVPPFRGRC